MTATKTMVGAIFGGLGAIAAAIGIYQFGKSNNDLSITPYQDMNASGAQAINSAKLSELEKKLANLESENMALANRLETNRAENEKLRKALSKQDNSRLNKEHSASFENNVDKPLSQHIPNSPKAIMVGNYNFELLSCRRSDQLTICEFIVTNYGKYEETRFYRQDLKGVSRAISPSGEVYEAMELYIGNKGGTDRSMKVDLPKGVGVKGRVSFTGYKDSSMSLLDIKIGAGVAVPLPAKFPDVKIL